MPVPGSGPLKLYGDIGVEIGVSQTNVSLGQMSDTAGFVAPDAMGDFYGYSSVTLATVSTTGINSVGTTTMRLCGSVNDLGGAPAVCRGFYFGPYSNYASNPKITQSNSAGTGGYCLDRSGLSQGSTYYSRAWACNGAGNAIAPNQCSATTQVVFPVTIGSAAFNSIESNLCSAPKSSPASYFGGSSAYQSPNQGWIGLAGHSQTTPGSGGQSRTFYLAPGGGASNPGINNRAYGHVASYPGWWGPSSCGTGTIGSVNLQGGSKHSNYGSQWGNQTNVQSGQTTTTFRKCPGTYGASWWHASYCSTCPSDVRVKTNITYL